MATTSVWKVNKDVTDITFVKLLLIFFSYLQNGELFFDLIQIMCFCAQNIQIHDLNKLVFQFPIVFFFCLV